MVSFGHTPVTERHTGRQRGRKWQTAGNSSGHFGAALITSPRLRVQQHDEAPWLEGRLRGRIGLTEHGVILMTVNAIRLSACGVLLSLLSHTVLNFLTLPRGLQWRKSVSMQRSEAFLCAQPASSKFIFIIHVWHTLIFNFNFTLISLIVLRDLMSLTAVVDAESGCLVCTSSSPSLYNQLLSFRRCLQRRPKNDSAGAMTEHTGSELHVFRVSWRVSVCVCVCRLV